MISFIVLLCGPILVSAANPTWIVLNMTAPEIMQDVDYWFPEVPVQIGTPSQEMTLVVDLSSRATAAYSESCDWCVGYNFFDPSQSTTLNQTNSTWSLSSSEFNGPYVQDTVGFGGSITAPSTDFVLIETMSTSFYPRLQSGILGLYVNNSAGSENQKKNILTQLWATKSLLNPVVGMRFDPVHTKMTIGALDPNDYEGTINWVQMESPQWDWDFPNLVKIDGIKGYNGSFIPWGDNLRAALNTWGPDVVVPNANTYVMNPNYTGPVQTINLYPDAEFFGFGPCNYTTGLTPYVPLTVTINGVDYPLDSKGNMLRPSSGYSAPGICNVAMVNRTMDGEPPEVILGLPFLRSVYTAYRFPTDDCPGYYGFAYPAGSNRTQAEKAQQPKAKPTNSAQCLSFAKPTSAPISGSGLSGGMAPLEMPGSYSVYGRPGDGQVSLVGADELPKRVWSRPSSST